MCDVLPTAQLTFPSNTVRYRDMPRAHVVEVDVNCYLLYAAFGFVIVRYLVSLLALLSGYKSNRINWLEIEGCGSLESMS